MDAVIIVIVLQKQRNEWNVTNYKLCTYSVLYYVLYYVLFYILFIYFKKFKD